ncbi:MAG: CIA30 family protein [Luteolibacter sp.]|jgi:NADH dehydrogenase [ubiquinone] 1 alpha subcomplex assembly factor 1
MFSLTSITTLAFILFLSLFAPTARGVESSQRQTELHLKFDGDSEEPAWTPQNDSVMGGISKGRSVIRDGVLEFMGALSLENNGGFAQVRIPRLNHDLSGKKGMKLRVMGDGRTYEFRLATDARHRGSRIAYSVEFPTVAGEWTEVEVRFADLEASHRGDKLDGPPANLSRIEEMSFLLADGIEGPFSLKVDWMRAE